MKIDRRESEGRNDAEMLLQMLSPPDHVIPRYTEASPRFRSISFPIHLWGCWCWRACACARVCVRLRARDVKMATFNSQQGSGFGQTPTERSKRALSLPDVVVLYPKIKRCSAHRQTLRPFDAAALLIRAPKRLRDKNILLCGCCVDVRHRVITAIRPDKRTLLFRIYRLRLDAARPFDSPVASTAPVSNGPSGTLRTAPRGEVSAFEG